MLVGTLRALHRRPQTHRSMSGLATSDFWVEADLPRS
jgi:hypothetical protein